MKLKDSEETLDGLGLTGRKIYQKKRGQRFSLDAVLVSSFVCLEKAKRVADLGTGSGVIPLLLANSEAIRFVGIERQSDLVEMARRSLALNGLQESIEIVQGDVCDIGRMFVAQSFDIVVSNPPFRQLESGRKAPDAVRAAARHELAGGLKDFVAAAAYLLKNGGRFYVVFLAERLADLLTVMRDKKIEPKRLRMVHSRPGDEAKLVLVEGRRAGRPGLKVESPLFIYAGDKYSDEVLACYGTEID